MLRNKLRRSALRSLSTPTCALNPAGFTLIELMVVILIMAIVMGSLLPVLRSARIKTRSVVCLSHIRQWGIAVWMYSEEDDEFFPYEGNSFRPINRGSNLQAWYNVVPDYAGQSSLMDLYEMGRIPLPGERSLFACPSVTRSPAETPTVTRPYFLYGFNNRLDPNGPGRFRRHQVWQPAQTVVFTENSEFRYPSASGRFTPARHDGRANLGFVDGHAEGIRSNQFVRTKSEDFRSREEWSRSRNVYWYPYPGAPR